MQHTEQFNYEAERAYYSNPVASIRPYEWLDKDLAAWVPDYPRLFHGKTILDMGAGECLQGMLIAERYAPRLIVPLELNFNQLTAVTAKSDAWPRMKLVSGDCYHLPFQNHTFDIAFGNGILHHLPNLPAVAREVARVVRPGGLYIGREPNFCNFVVRRRVLGTSHRSENEHAIYVQDVQQAFRENGFTVTVDYFWRRFPWVRGRWLAAAMRILAVR